MRVALYARVSSERQEKERTIESQVEVLTSKAAEEGWAVEMTCLDNGYSGSRLDRPGLDRVRDAAAAGLVDGVVVLCPDRLARDYVHQMLVLQELSRFGVKVIFCEEGLGDDPAGRLSVQIQAAVAEFERTKIMERNRRGKLFKARQGAVVAGQVPYGYRKVPAADGLPTRLEICEPEAAVVRRIFHLHANEGLSVRGIMIRLAQEEIASPKGRPVWHTSAIGRTLRSEVYAGSLYYNRSSLLAPEARLSPHSPGYRPTIQIRPREEWIEISVPAIVDLDTWTRSQARHETQSKFSPRNVGAERYLLRYLVHCGECGRARNSVARRRSDGTGEHRYYCCHSIYPKHLREGAEACAQPSSHADHLDQVVWGEVVRHLTNPDLILNACLPQLDPIGDDNAGTRAIERRLAEVRAQSRRLIDGYQAGAIPLEALQARERPLRDRIAELDRELAAARMGATSRAQTERQIEAFTQELSGNLELMAFAQRQELLRTVLEKVVVTESRVELLFKIPLAPPPRSGGDSGPDGLRSGRAVPGLLRRLRRPRARAP
jgi:site-specific DNA recombinase